MRFIVFFLGVFVIFPSAFSCNCFSIISNKNQTFNPSISTSPLYSGLKTRHIVIYVTKIKHWIEISRFSKSGLRCWPKNFRNLLFGKKVAKPKNFLPTKIFDNKVMPTDLDVLRQNESKSYCKNILANT